MPGGRAKEVEVRIRGRRRYLRLGTNAMVIVEEQTGVNLLAGEPISVRVTRALCYGALVVGAKENDEPVDFTIDDVGNWMEEELEDGRKLAEIVLGLQKEALPEKPATDPSQVQEETPGPALAAS